MSRAIALERSRKQIALALGVPSMPRDEPERDSTPQPNPEQHLSPDQGETPGRHVALVLGAGGALGYAHSGLTRRSPRPRAFEAMQSVVNPYRLAGFPPDVLITSPKDACRTLDFHRAAPMVELVRQLTATALDRFEARTATTPDTT